MRPRAARLRTTIQRKSPSSSRPWGRPDPPAQARSRVSSSLVPARSRAAASERVVPSSARPSSSRALSASRARAAACATRGTKCGTIRCSAYRAIRARIDALASVVHVAAKTSRKVDGDTSAPCTPSMSADQTTARAWASGTRPSWAGNPSSVASSSRTRAHVRSPALGTRTAGAVAPRRSSSGVRSSVTVTVTRTTSTPSRHPATSRACGRSAGWSAGGTRSSRAEVTTAGAAPSAVRGSPADPAGGPVTSSAETLSRPAVRSQPSDHGPRSRPLARSIAPRNSASVPLP